MSSADYDIVALQLLLFAAFLSIIGELFIIVDVLFRLLGCKKINNTLKKHSQYILYCLLLIGITDFGDSCFELMGIVDYISNQHASSNNTSCLIQAAGTQIASVSTVLYGTAVALIMYCLAFEIPITVRNIYCMHAFIWIISIVLTIPPFFTHSYSDAGLHCWINENFAGLIFRLTLFYIMPLWICIFYVLWVYYKIYHKLKNDLNTLIDSVSLKEKKKQLMQLIFFPMTFIIGYAPATILRTINYINRWGTPVHAPFWFSIFCYVCLLLVGFFDAIFYIILFYGNDIRKKCSKRNAQECSSDQNTTTGNINKSNSTSHTLSDCLSRTVEMVHSHVSSSEQIRRAEEQKRLINEGSTCATEML